MHYQTPPPPAPPGPPRRQPKPPPSLRRIGLVAGAVAGLVALIGIAAALDGGPASTPTSSTSTTPAAASPTTAPAADPRPGSPEVYAEIEASTDCRSLQSTFDRASANFDRATANGDAAEREWTLSYMQAADARMQALGCPTG